MDLPGYGYAKVPLKLKAHWRTVMARYFQTRECLRGVVLVMDIRHPMREFDQQMLAWCDSANIPCHILLTKADKLKRGPAQSTLLTVSRDLPDIASIQIFSSSKKTGVDELVDKLSDWYEYEYDGEQG
jgi:GTP-binding protein